MLLKRDFQGTKIKVRTVEPRGPSANMPGNQGNNHQQHHHLEEEKKEETQQAHLLRGSITISSIKTLMRSTSSNAKLQRSSGSIVNLHSKTLRNYSKTLLKKSYLSITGI
jgi:hypothetical protein